MQKWIRQLKHQRSFNLSLFLRQLATLISSGIPMVKSFNLLESTQTNPILRLLIHTMKRDLLCGKSLFEIVSHSPFFDKLTCQLIKIGEVTGKLDDMLCLVADHHEKAQTLQKRLKQILFYPCIVLFTALSVTLSMLIFIIPRFAELFQETQDTLPWLTKTIFALSSSLNNHIIYIFIIIFIIVIIFCSKASTSFKIICVEWFKQLPLINSSIRKILLARFARHLAISFSAGIPINDALKLCIDSSVNMEFSNNITQLTNQVSAGFQLHQAMESLNYFPTLMIQMIKIGEESGMLDSMLKKIAESIETEIDQLIAQLSQLLEPLIMLILGVLIGGLIIGMYLPIFKLGNTL